MGITEALAGTSYALKDKSRISNCWKLLGIKENDLTWYYDSSVPSPYIHEQILIATLPKDATGHKGISHGGLIATIIDEALCFGAYPVLPHQTGVTASLNVNYLRPIPAGSTVLLKSKAEGREGSRKATIDAELYLVDPEDTKLPYEDETQLLVKASQVVVEPKWHDELTHK